MPSASRPSDAQLAAGPFAERHIGPREPDVARMLEAVGADSMAALIDEAMPGAIRTDRPLDLPPAASEADALAELRALAEANRVLRPFIGLGYSGTVTPPVILRGVLENPGWYTQ